jgi:hypothetical protein
METKYYISPNFDPSKYETKNVEDLIDVFEDRTLHWLFEPIRNLLDLQNGYMAAFGLILSYFEGITIYIRGKDSMGNSATFFKEGFLAVLKTAGHDDDLLERVAEIIYSDGRCGFFHDGFGFRGRILIAPKANKDMIITLPEKDGVVDEKGPIESIIINPSRIFSIVEKHFIQYIYQLKEKSDQDLIENFEKACKIKWGIDDPPVAIGLDP